MSKYKPFPFFLIRTPLLSISENPLRGISLENKKLIEKTLQTSAGGFYNKFRNSPSSSNDLKLPLNKYHLRMMGRPLGHALFSGVSVGRIAEETDLLLDRRSSSIVYSEPDRKELFKTIFLHSKGNISDETTLIKNPTLLQHGTTIEFSSMKMGEKEIEYSFRKLKLSKPILELILSLPSSITVGNLKIRLSRFKELKKNNEQIKKAIDLWLTQQIFYVSPSPYYKKHFKTITSRSLAQFLESNEDPLLANDRDFQLHKKMKHNSLATATALDVIQGAEILIRLFQHQMARLKSETPFSHFRKTFSERYGETNVPLLRAIYDYRDETGPAPAPKTEFEFESALLNLMIEKKSFETGILELDRKNLAYLEKADQKSFPEKISPPDSMSVNVQIDTLGRIFYTHILGPPMGRHFSRYSYDGSSMAEAAKALNDQEFESQKHFIAADLNSWPSQLKLANVQSKSFFNSFQIIVTGLEHPQNKKQIPLSDLSISMVNGQLVLKSLSLNQVVKPVLNDLYVARFDFNPIFSFLYELLNQDTFMIHSWLWGRLNSLDFLPRVVFKNYVFSASTWRLAGDVVKTRRSQDLTDWRRHFKNLNIPTVVALQDEDKVLPFDTSDDRQLTTLIQSLKTDRDNFVCEVFQNPFAESNLLVKGPEGAYVSELILPCFNSSAQQSKATSVPKKSISLTTPQHWTVADGCVYFKISARPSDFNFIISSIYQMMAGRAKSWPMTHWFFIRYSTPAPHLRMRFFAPKGSDSLKLQSIIMGQLTTLMNDGWIKDFALSIYHREIDRYGGPRSLDLIEKIFSVDSDNVSQWISRPRGSTTETKQSSLIFVLQSLSAYIDEFLPTKKQRDAFLARLSPSPTRKVAALSDYFQIYREYRLNQDEKLLALVSEVDRHLEIRKKQLQPLVRRFHKLHSGASGTPHRDGILFSFLHTHINRLGLSATPSLEDAIFEMVRKIYLSNKHKNQRGHS
jgi:thiopeptide-type bacteriocin biosynthesis protein